MKTSRIFFAPVNLAKLIKIENGVRVPVRYTVIHRLAPIYQYKDYYKSIKTGVKYKTSENCNANELYVNENRLISFSDVIKKLEEVDQEKYIVPKHISKRKMLSLVTKK